MVRASARQNFDGDAVHQLEILVTISMILPDGTIEKIALEEGEWQGSMRDNIRIADRRQGEILAAY